MFVRFYFILSLCDFRMSNCQNLSQEILDHYWKDCFKEILTKDWVVKEMGKAVFNMLCVTSILLYLYLIKSMLMLLAMCMLNEWTAFLRSWIVCQMFSESEGYVTVFSDFYHCTLSWCWWILSTSSHPLRFKIHLILPFHCGLGQHSWYSDSLEAGQSAD